jgi:TRAP-type C4-dicarboxylate transport system permease small subunit
MAGVVPNAKAGLMPRLLLDALYRLCLWLAALCLVGIAVMVGLQLAGRIFDIVLAVIGRPPAGIVILSLAEICGFLLCGASFLALASTLKSGAHIRVTMLLAAFPDSIRRWIEMWAFAASAAFSLYMTWQLALFSYYSWKFNEVSSGVVAVKLAYPQAVMAIGAGMLSLALIDELVTVFRRGRPTFRAAEDAITLGKEG